MYYTIVNNSSNILADRLLIADNFYSRLKGLIGNKKINPGEGLLLVSCSSIHTMFMRFNIDVAFLDKEYRILKVVSDFTPWRVIIPVLGAKYVLELPPGTIKATGTKTGDCLFMHQ